MSSDALAPQTSAHRTADATVSIALGGGGARGLAHIHVIEVLDELGIRPQLIAGSSIGAIMGAAMAAGLSGREVREHTLDAVGRPGDALGRIWGLRPATLSDFWSNGLRFGQFNLERVLRAFLHPDIPDRFEELKIPLKVVTADFYAQREHICETGALFPAIAASASLPALFMPVRIDGRVLVDGGLWNPVPFDHLAGTADITVGVDVVGHPSGDEGQLPNGIDSLYGASQLTMRAMIELKLKQGAPDIFLRPEVGRFRVLDFLRAREILEHTAGIREEFKRALDVQFERHARKRG
ncbi:patatin-like phospholipase family protein (plasmid) [Rhizobium sp. TRM96647]|uniref:patatin-like phospholipase family protein n=1 Tax=unclassified Rhizobium TaxID=2613769 RepID=UPI001E41FE72|nr:MULTISPECIES: patatin-like phospholipase family protein [unclassified Rhizobium]MCD2180660.1 patatin-like phospholipase family protein [Rhizobium sp. GN54]MCV3735396.1 patatin-like phospholipase family protein [Rhizobium sp. TRM96647]MCV3757841.1 patatin-like phospholipase family protein [Rhizobium sp. TRM96650]